MTGLSLDIEKFAELARTLPVIDVRSPAEYAHAHITGAVNLPLFSNEERSIIGTLYLKRGSDEAMSKGIEMIRPKMREFAVTGHRIAGGGDALMHCWRGGMRSSSMAWLMNTVGIRTYTLNGGYKRFRRYTSEIFSRPLTLVVIGGRTGSGKTGVLKALRLHGCQVIDLEGLASHKGSVFGGIGLPPQPSSEQFENNLFAEILKLDPLKPVFIEDESLSIGDVFIPREFYNQMSSSLFVKLDVPFNERLMNLLTAYTIGTDEMLVNGVRRLSRRIGLEHAVKAENFINAGQLEQAAVIVLHYYDKLYDSSMTRHKRSETYELEVRNESPADIADRILTITQKWN